MLFNPHELRKLLKRYGIEVEELKDIERVEFYTSSKKLVAKSPQVVTYKMQGQVIYQIIAQEISEEPLEATGVEHETSGVLQISEDDIRFIVEHTGVTRDKAVEALMKAKGDLAKAIMIIQGESKT